VFWDADAANLTKSDLEPDYKKFATVRDFFQLRGYEVLLPGALADWLNKRISDRGAKRDYVSDGHFSINDRRA
jgi:hypothetical protein